MTGSGRRVGLAIAAVLAVALTTLGTIYLSRAMAKATAVAAVVNGDVIYQREVNAEVDLVALQYGFTFEGKEGEAQRKELAKAVLDQLIDRSVLMQEARKLGQVATDNEVDRRLTDIRGSFESEEAFQEALAVRNLNLVSLRERIRVDQTVNRLIKAFGNEVEVSEAEVRDYFVKHRSEFDRPEQIRVRHILVSTEAEAKVILGKLQRGMDFADLAKQHSIDPTSKEQGGDLGFIAPGRYEEAFIEAAKTLPVGKVSDPVKTSQGYHILQVLERRPARPAVYAEVKERIRETLQQQKAEERFEGWFRGVRSKAQVTRFDRPAE